MTEEILSECEKMLIEILNEIVDKMHTESLDKEEIRKKISNLHSLLHYESTGWK